MSNDKHTAEQIRNFGKTLKNEIDRYKLYVAAKKVNPRDAQRAQVELLLDLEANFQDAIRTHSKGLWAYKRFVKYITQEKGNILHARPYFRERQQFFTKKISPALKTENAKLLQGFRANFRLIQFLYDQRRWTVRINKLYDRICRVREEICVTNMPLAMSRARIFFSKTPKSHLTYPDLIQISSEGLLSAIDKYVPTPGEPFRGLANIVINRITGNLIERSSETVLHFFPPDKKKLYRGYKESRSSNGDLQVLADKVNEGVTNPREMTTPDEMAQLLSANSCISTETAIESSESKASSKITTIGETLPADDSWRPDVITEAYEERKRLFEAISKLSPFKQKLLRLRGISV